MLEIFPFLPPLPSPRVFFLRASTVDPPDVKLGIDEYSDVTMLAKPVIYISIKEICSTHSVSNVRLCVCVCVSMNCTLYSVIRLDCISLLCMNTLYCDDHCRTDRMNVVSNTMSVHKQVPCTVMTFTNQTG